MTAAEREVESDAELVERARAGDERAATELVRRHQAELRRVFTSRNLQPATVDDLTQESLLGCFRRLDRLARPERFRAWLLEIARHKLSDHYRACARARARFVRSEESPEHPCERSYAAISAIEAEDDRAALAEALARLSKRSQLLMKQYYWHELPRTEIAAQLGIPVGTVGSRLSYARRQLASTLERRLA